jgi:cytochrome c556
MRQLAAGLTIVALALASLPGRADDQDVIDYRTHVMKTLGEQAGALVMILDNRGPAENLGLHLKVMAATAAQAKKAFEPKVPGGNAKPEVWTNWPDFSKRLDELVAATAEVAASSQHDSVAAVKDKLKSVKCSSCHDTYRIPPK